ncbi:LacI family transcriptional regulator [Endozoicomonas montiporae]|uniref:LacI family transcriptional regulator n=2 Tax=Endozoicomonas montiporae TaxID=1027273 RepID=A0A081N511_9GAMM|nr:LacI family DNA-binding transcriptional regulator [Endozoicomonas montiporae]AMO57595.1 transcriptional regulator, LacI family protein [Endozoicomonas montiporae CL-33]KEQ13534.1 LacI family transcriptional regulator [Endozoicomonas montiporae]
MATIKDVAEHAQVSRATVSRVLNNTGQVTESTRDRVNAAIKELDYRPNPVAQSLACNTSNTIGLMVSSFRGGFFGDLMAQVQQVVDTAGKVMIVTQGKHSADSERAALEHLTNMRCDGLLLHVRYLSDEELIELAEKLPPFVLLDRHIEALSDRCVTFDHVAAGEKAVQVLMEQGHQQIACLAGKLFKDNARQRFQGYANKLKEKAIPLDMELVTEGGYDRESGYRGMKQILKTGKTITAVYACSEEMAVGCMDALQEQGIKVPDDISLISYDSVDLCTLLTPHVSALHFPITEMASVAGTLLMNQMHIEGFNKPAHQHFEGELRIRQSVKSCL